MVGNTPPEFLVDLAMNVSFQNGVFRITFGQVDSQNRAVPVTRLLIPASQMPTIIKGLAAANQDIAKQLQERAKKARGAAEEKGKAATQPKIDTKDKKKK